MSSPSPVNGLNFRSNFLGLGPGHWVAQFLRGAGGVEVGVLQLRITSSRTTRWNVYLCPYAQGIQVLVPITWVPKKVTVAKWKTEGTWVLFLFRRTLRFHLFSCFTSNQCKEWEAYWILSSHQHPINCMKCKYRRLNEYFRKCELKQYVFESWKKLWTCKTYIYFSFVYLNTHVSKPTCFKHTNLLTFSALNVERFHKQMLGDKK